MIFGPVWRGLDTMNLVAIIGTAFLVVVLFAVFVWVVVHIFHTSDVQYSGKFLQWLRKKNPEAKKKSDQQYTTIEEGNFIGDRSD